MKTQKFFLFLAIFMAVTIGINAQTRQQRKALEKVATEKAALEKELAELENSIATYVAIDTLPTYSRKKEIDQALASGEMSIKQKAAYSDQSHKLGRKLAAMRQQLLVDTASFAYCSRRINEIKFRLQKLNDYQTDLINNQLDEAVNQIPPQEMSSREAKRRHRGNIIKMETNKAAFQEKLQAMSVSKKEAAPVIADPINGFFGRVINRSSHTVYNFVIYEKNSKAELKSFVLEPGTSASNYFLPGEYACDVKAYGVIVAHYEFHVTADTHDVFGEELHWAVWQESEVRKPMAKNITLNH